MATHPGYSALKANNLALTARATAPGTARQFLTAWRPDQPEDATDSFLVVLGPDGLGDGTRKKHFRGIQVSGAGTATVIAFGYSSLNEPMFLGEATFDMQDLSDQGNILWFRRGSKGYFFQAFLVIQGRLDWADALYENLQKIEEGQ